MHTRVLPPKAELFTEQSCQKVLRELLFKPEDRGESFTVSLVSIGRQRELSMGKIHIRRTGPVRAAYIFPDRSQAFDTLAKVDGENPWYDITVILQMGEDVAAQPARIVIEPRMTRRLSVA